VAGGLGKHEKDGGIERTARGVNKQRDESSTRELGVRETRGRGAEGWGCGTHHAGVLGISGGERNAIKTQHLPNAVHLNSPTKHRVTLYGFQFSKLSAQTLILRPRSKELFETKRAAPLC